jgi:hypothetical protein
MTAMLRDHSDSGAVLRSVSSVFIRWLDFSSVRFLRRKCADAFHKLRSVTFRNAIASPFTRKTRSRWTACDEPRNISDEQYRKGVRQDSSEKPVNIALRAMRRQGIETLSFLENSSSVADILWKALASVWRFHARSIVHTGTIDDLRSNFLTKKAYNHSHFSPSKKAKGFHGVSV